MENSQADAAPKFCLPFARHLFLNADDDNNDNDSDNG